MTRAALAALAATVLAAAGCPADDGPIITQTPDAGPRPDAAAPADGGLALDGSGADAPVGGDVTGTTRIRHLAAVPIEVPRDAEIAALTDSGAELPATLPGDGTFTIAGVPAGPYWLRIVAPDLGTVFIRTSGRELALDTTVLGRPDVVTGIAGSGILLDTTGMAAWAEGDQLQIFSANAGSIVRFDAGVIGATSVTDLFVPYDGLPLIDGTAGDGAAIYQLEAKTSGTTAYRALTKRADLPAFAMTPGAATDVSVNLTSAPGKSQPFTWKRTLFQVYGADVHPAATLAAESLVAAAFPELPFHGPAGATPDLFVIVTDLFTTDLALTMQYADPFPTAWKRVGRAAFTYAVEVPVPGASSPLAVTGEIVRWNDVAMLDPAVEPVVSPPTAPLVAGQDAFGPQSGVGTTPTISWSAPALGTPDAYEVTVARVYALGDGTPTSEPVARFLTADRTLTVPGGVLVAGESYVFTITASADAALDLERQPFAAGIAGGSAAVVTSTIAP